MNAIEQLIEKKSLTAKECLEAFNDFLDQPVRMGAFLSLLKAKGETAEEILGLVKAMRNQMREVKLDRPTLDIVGTGGDRAGTVNISTGAALLAARSGICIVKHGNRSISSQSGSADVLEAMGYPIHQTPEEIQKNVETTGFGFCFAPDYHPVLKKVDSVRKALGFPTLFNLIGPLLNPAGTEHLQIGVYLPEFAALLAEVLYRLGTKRSLVYSGHGIDELSCLGPTDAILVTEKGLEMLTIDPEKLGLKKCTLKDLAGADAITNARLLNNPPDGLRDTLLLNAGVALFLYGLVSSIEEGIWLARRKLKRSLKEAIKRSSGALIAEIKRASPSKGKIGDIPDPAQRALFYESNGARAISVLTSDRFEGSLVDLDVVKNVVSIPVLRKDFVTNFDQLLESDADAVLLIVANLGERTKEMLDFAKKLGLEAIVEVHNREELDIALSSGAEMIGVNQRNLKDFTMHPEVYGLISEIPSHIVKIAESGVRNSSDAQRLFDLGYDAILVGEALTLNPLLCGELCLLKSVV
ncbi:MAG TPA: anthranilate phosphoribosyltransferase [Parachlamydiales bacterium]|nr:anthranilate phosphoribosyltransferase [Parachlamydiales bacterium]